MDKLLKAIQAVLDSEDSTGCDGDLTVVNLSAIEELRKQRDSYVKKAGKK